MFSPWSEVGDLTGVGGDVDISVDSLSITLAPFLSVCRIHNFLRNFLASFAHQCQSMLTSHCHCFSTPSKEYLKLTHLLLEDQIWSLSFLYFAQFALFFFDVNFELLPISVTVWTCASPTLNVKTVQFICLLTTCLAWEGEALRLKNELGLINSQHLEEAQRL